MKPYEKQIHTALKALGVMGKFSAQDYRRYEPSGSNREQQELRHYQKYLCELR